MVTSFAAPQQALDALDTTIISAVYIGGVTVDAISWNPRFGRQSPIATCTITMPLPRPSVVTDNAVVQCIGGHNDLAGTMFSGRIPQWRNAMSLRGNLLTITAVGWASLLTYKTPVHLIFDGPIPAHVVLDAVCSRYGIPAYRADPIYDPTGTILITLGGNPQIDEGKFIIKADTAPWQVLNSAYREFHHVIMDTPDGTVRPARMAGLPSGEPAITFTEGVHLMSASMDHDIRGIVNYPNIEGPTYEDQDGASVPIRAAPSTVTADSRIPVNGGVNRENTRSNLLVTQQMAEIVLQYRLLDESQPAEPVTWEAVAVPGVAPGDVVEVDCGTVEVDGRYWLTDLSITCSGGTLTADYDGWAGTGETAGVLDNSYEIPIQSAPIHLGDETLSHYAVPSPLAYRWIEDKKVHDKMWSFTIPDRATAVNVRGLHHGTNSQLIGGVNEDIEVTKWQVWEASVPASKYDTTGKDAPRPVASGNMPTVNEDLALRKNYKLLSNWAPFAVNLSRLDPGQYVLRLVAGVKAGPDDFEVREVVLEVWGTAEPAVIPQEVT